MTIQTENFSAVSANVSVLEGLQPHTLWKYFELLSAIPRPSKEEHRVLEWLKSFADKRKLIWQQDAIGNLVIRRPGTGGAELASTVVVQGHVDMVCEKNAGVKHDFSKDGIRLVRDGDWLRAAGTTLGADNGLGVATALALLDCPSDMKLPPLECLFTVDEEAGMGGAIKLDGGMLSGRIMLNLDTEDWGDIYIGCAGGCDTEVVIPVQQEGLPAQAEAVEVAVYGLMGGHSGLHIHEDRGNAVVMCAQVVEAVLKAVPAARLTWMAGGDKHNAIPRECRATLLVPREALHRLQQVVAEEGLVLQLQYGCKERGLKVAARECGSQRPDTCLTPHSSHRLLCALLTLPHGVIKFSHAVPGLVETSNNVATVEAGPVSAEGRVEQYSIWTSARSSFGPALERVQQGMERIAHLCGGSAHRGVPYPGWAPHPESHVVQVTKRVMAGVVGYAPQVKAIHAGLECGMIGERVPGMDMVSYGPTIRNAHSPDECLQISTVFPFWQTTVGVLQAIADEQLAVK